MLPSSTFATVVRKAERFAHHVAHPGQAVRYQVHHHTTGRVRRAMHRAVDKFCCAIM
jgi:DNA-binding sugar fermentation-stimulating protein